MARYRTPIAYLTSVLCGVAYVYSLAQLFGRVLVPNPINQWLIENLARAGHEVGYKLAIYSHDFLVYIIVAIPFAAMLSLLPPRGSWRYLLVALGASLSVRYWAPLTDPSALARLAELWQFYVGLGMSILSLPISFAAVRAIKKQRRVSTEATTSLADAE